MACARVYERADGAPETVRVAGVRFRKAGKIYYFDPGPEDFMPGERVVVQTNEGPEVGDVVIRSKLVPIDVVVLPLQPILRRAEDADRQRLIENRQTEKAALEVAEERIRAHGLPMKLVSAEAAFDASRLKFFFVAEKRVDFRTLVKDLSSQFRTRIELRQIGVRDQAKMVGGIGDCGRELCCTTWMGDFEPVSIRMAKLQSLSLSPSRLSGQCGRLKCCLKYENDTYREVLRELPKIGATVGTSQGKGKVIEILVIKESVLVDLGEGKRIIVKGSELIDPELAPDGPVESVSERPDANSSRFTSDVAAARESGPEQGGDTFSLAAVEAPSSNSDTESVREKHPRSENQKLKGRSKSAGGRRRSGRRGSGRGRTAGATVERDGSPSGHSRDDTSEQEGAKIRGKQRMRSQPGGDPQDDRPRSKRGREEPGLHRDTGENQPRGNRPPNRRRRRHRKGPQSDAAT